MSKYLIIAIAILGTLLFFAGKKMINDSRTIDRIEQAYKIIEDDSKVLSLKYNELNKRQEIRIGKLSDSLKIKPKFIVRYVNIKTTDTIHIIDTVYREGIYIGPGMYSFNQDTGCFHIEWVVDAINKVPRSALTNLIYDNEIEYLVYLERRKKEFWFIKYRSWFKKDAKLKSTSKCGKSKVEDINIIKK